MAGRTNRKCENWIDTFLEWTLPVSEAPESFLTWAGLFCLSAILKRRVRYAKDLLKMWDVYPTSYIMFVAPPGVAKKSTTSGYTERLLMEYNTTINVTDPSYVNLGPTSGSDIRMIEAMSETTDGSMTIIAGEFGNIVKTRTAETYDFFTKMFDNDPAYIHDTMGGGKFSVLDPSFNILGCTTPDWMANNTGYITGGGFAARTIFIFEQRARQRKLFDKEYYEEEGILKSRDIGPNVKRMEELRSNLLHDLKIIGQLKGEARPENLKLEKEFVDWYKDYIDQPIERGNETFQQRKHVHTLRTAMLLSICERDDLLISSAHFKRALSLINYVEKRLSRGFSTVGHNPYSGAYYQVLDYIEVHKDVKKGQVQAYFFKDIPLDELAKIFEVLKMAGEIEEIMSNPPRLRLVKK